MWHDTGDIMCLFFMLQQVVFAVEMLHSIQAARPLNVKVTVVGEWMSNLLDIPEQSQQRVVQTL